LTRRGKPRHRMDCRGPTAFAMTVGVNCLSPSSLSPAVVIARNEATRQSMRKLGLLRRVFGSEGVPPSVVGLWGDGSMTVVEGGGIVRWRRVGWGSCGLLCRFAPRNDGVGGIGGVWVDGWVTNFPPLEGCPKGGVVGGLGERKMAFRVSHETTPSALRRPSLRGREFCAPMLPPSSLRGPQARGNPCGGRSTRRTKPQLRMKY
jgi:hypothetical protein